MSNIAKSLALTLVLVMAISSASLLTLKPVSAQSTGILAAPTFSVILTNASYSVPPAHYIDPQTGANITKAGYFVNQENLTFTIQNKPNVTWYVIRWTTPYMTGWNIIEGYILGDPMNATIERTSGSTTNWVLTGTNGSFPIYENGLPVETVVGYIFTFDTQNLDFESGAKIEFQVQASSGSPVLTSIIPEVAYSIVGETSDWSNTQTVNIPVSSVSPASSPTSTPAVPELSWLIIVPLLLSVLSVAVILRHRKSMKIGRWRAAVNRKKL